MTSKLSRLMFAFLALAPALAFAVPNTVGFSARVADNGQPVTGSHEFIFRFWDCDGTDTVNCVAGSAHVLWEETQTLDVTNGVVTAGLGTVTAFGANVFDGTDRWFSVTMDAVDFGPFLAVRSVPYATRAGTAETALNVQCSGCVNDADVAAGIAGSKISGAVASAYSVTYPAPVTKVLRIPGGGCVRTVNNGLYPERLFLCTLSDGVTNTSARWPVIIPTGATIVGFQVSAWATGTIDCFLKYGVDGWTEYQLATVSKTGATWTPTAEVALNHYVSGAYGYGVYCIASGAASSQGIGTIFIRYTINSP